MNILNIDIGTWIIKEERTREYLNNIPLWNEELLLEEDGEVKEYLFTGGMEREEFFDWLEKEIGYALVYSPRHLIQKGHFFDLIFVKIGDKNMTGIKELWDVGKNDDGSFTKLPDCINRR